MTIFCILLDHSCENVLTFDQIGFLILKQCFLRTVDSKNKIPIRSNLEFLLLLNKEKLLIIELLNLNNFPRPSSPLNMVVAIF